MLIIWTKYKKFLEQKLIYKYNYKNIKANFFIYFLYIPSNICNQVEVTVSVEIPFLFCAVTRCHPNLGQKESYVERSLCFLTKHERNE